MSTWGPIRRRGFVLAFALLAPALGAAGTASARAPQEFNYIFGGRPTSDCEWPNVAKVGGCTATLMSPSILVLAAHCGVDHEFAYFEGGRHRVPIKHCKVNPKFGQKTLGQGIDWGYCKLADTSWTEEVPLVPPLRHEELEQIEVPYPVTLVGYGRNDIEMEPGQLAEVDTWLTKLGQEASIGGKGADSCQGDSGGPAFVQLKDNSWRVLGITSYGGACGKGGRYALYANAISWVEKTSNERIANCDPSSRVSCETLMLDPAGNYGREGPHCLPGPLLEEGSNRLRVPELGWTTPSPSALIEDDARVEARLELRHIQRLAGARLEIELDGEVIQIHDRLHEEVFVTVSALAPGQHVLRAKIYDEDDEVRNVARTAFRWQISKTPAVLNSDREVLEQSMVDNDDRSAGCRAQVSPSSGWLSLLGLGMLLRGLRRRMRKASC